MVSHAHRTRRANINSRSSIDTIKSVFISLVWVASLSWSHALCTTPTPARLAWLRDFQPLKNFRPLFSRLAPMRVSVTLQSMRGGIGSVDGAHGSFSTDAVEVYSFMDLSLFTCSGACIYHYSDRERERERGRERDHTQTHTHTITENVCAYVYPRISWL